VEHGTSQFSLPGVLKISPISNYGNVSEIAQLFGGLDELKNSIHQLQVLLYAA
jgi:type I restriction enzyme R subunit